MKVLDTGGCSQANSLGGCEKTNGRCPSVLGKMPKLSRGFYLDRV